MAAKVPDNHPWQGDIHSTLENFEKSIRDNAVAYHVNLFLGCGQWEKAEAISLSEARSLASEMQRAHPETSRKSMIYAVDSQGHSTLIV